MLYSGMRPLFVSEKRIAVTEARTHVTDVHIQGERTLFFLKSGPIPAAFVYVRSFQTQISQKKTVGLSGTRTRIVRVESKQTDH